MTVRPQDTPERAYLAARYFLLCELCRVRAMVRIGTASVANTTKERKSLQREMAGFRKSRRASV